MSTNEIITKVETLQEYEAIINEASSIVESIKDELKRYMDALGVEELEAGTNIIRYATVLSQRLNSTQLKRDLPELYRSYLKQISSKRFSIS